MVCDLVIGNHSLLRFVLELISLSQLLTILLEEKRGRH